MNVIYELPKVLTDYIDQLNDVERGRLMTTKFVSHTLANQDFSAGCLIGVARGCVEKKVQVGWTRTLYPLVPADTFEVAETFNRTCDNWGPEMIGAVIRQYVLEHHLKPEPEEAEALATVS